MLRRTLIAVVAILAVTGTTAAAVSIITGKQIKNGSVTGKDIKNSSLDAGELSGAARASLRGQTGPPGAKGDPGPRGERGPSNAFFAQNQGAYVIDDAADSRQVIGGGALPPGSYVITAKVVVENNGPSDDRPLCRLGVMVGGFFDPIDRVDPLIDNVDPTKEAVLTLMGAAQVDAGNQGYLVECEPQAAVYSMRFRDRSLVALQVANLAN